MGDHPGQPVRGACLTGACPPPTDRLPSRAGRAVISSPENGTGSDERADRPTRPGEPAGSTPRCYHSQRKVTMATSRAASAQATSTARLSSGRPAPPSAARSSAASAVEGR
jgi:hypothetical protein